MQTDESHLVEQAKQGSHTAFRRLYDMHITPLYRFMRQFESNTDNIEEWAQRAFIKAYLNISHFEQSSRFSTWLFRLALNEMKMDKRTLAIIPLETVYDEDYSSVSSDVEFEWNDLMKAWLSELSETKRMVFLLYEVEGYSHAEIATMLGVGESTSRTILTRTKQFLQKQWQKSQEL